MPQIRYSPLVLWLKYVNREPRLIAMIVGLLFAAMVSPFAYPATAGIPYVLDGEMVQATVVSKHQASLRAGDKAVAAITPLFAHGKRGPRYVIHYEYMDLAGIKHTGEGDTSLSTWTNLKPGDTVAVRYVRSDPTRSQLDSSVREFSPLILVPLLGVTVIAVLVWNGCRSVRWVNRQVWLVRHGEAIPGRFTRAEVERRGRRRTEIVSVLEYEYAAPELLKGKLEMQGKLRSEWQTGGGIVILVDPADPSSHAPDIFGARREDADRLFPHRAAEN